MPHVAISYSDVRPLIMEQELPSKLSQYPKLDNEVPYHLGPGIENSLFSGLLNYAVSGISLLLESGSSSEEAFLLTSSADAEFGLEVWSEITE